MNPVICKAGTACKTLAVAAGPELFFVLIISIRFSDDQQFLLTPVLPLPGVNTD